MIVHGKYEDAAGLAIKGRQALVIALVAGLWIAGVRLGAALDYIGASSWLIVILSASAWGLTRAYREEERWGVRFDDLRRPTFWLTVLLAMTTLGAGGARADLASEGRTALAFAAVTSDPTSIRSFDERALADIRESLPAQVEAELQRRRLFERKQRAAQVTREDQERAKKLAEERARGQQERAQAVANRRAFDESLLGRMGNGFIAVLALVGWMLSDLFD